MGVRREGERERVTEQQGLKKERENERRETQKTGFMPPREEAEGPWLLSCLSQIDGGLREGSLATTCAKGLTRSGK